MGKEYKSISTFRTKTIYRQGYFRIYVTVEGNPATVLSPIMVADKYILKMKLRKFWSMLNKKISVRFSDNIKISWALKAEYSKTKRCVRRFVLFEHILVWTNHWVTFNSWIDPSFNCNIYSYNRIKGTHLIVICIRHGI